jgi:hypothetical protein
VPTTLTPQEQLTAANSQLKTWYNQQLAQRGVVLGGEYEAKAYAIVTSGNYPDLEVAVRNGTTGGFDTIFALPQDIGPYDTITSNNTGAGSGQLINTPRTNLTAQEYAAALAASNPNSAFDSALSSAYAAQTAREDAATAATTATTQPIVNANQGNPVIVPTPPTNSAAVNTAADNRDRQAGSVIAPSESNTIAIASAESAAASQEATNVETATTQTSRVSAAARNEAGSDTNSAQTNNTSVGTAVAPTVDPRGTNQIPTDATVVAPNTPNTSPNNGVSEDNPSGNPPQGTDTTSKPSSSISSDQTPTTNSDVAPKSGADSYNSGPNSGTARVTSSGPATNDSTSGISGSGSGSGNGGSSPSFSDTSNKLHAYTNSTYKISLYGVPASTINKLIGLDPSSDPGATLLNGAVFILSDGGRGASSGDKSYFPTDLTLDNLEIESIVSPNQRTRGTDVITMKFDIIEPYTTNFLEKCYKINQRFMPGVNASWDTLFFMMVIEFVGYDDMGRPQKIKNTTKYIPFTFLNMRFKITSSGTVYSCNVVCTNLLANTGIDNYIPFHVETQATTIKELFEATDFSGTTSKQVANRDRSGTETITTDLNAQSNLAKGNDIIISKGLQFALNQNERDKVKMRDEKGKITTDQDNAAAPINKGQYIANEYYFKFHKDILNAQIVDPKAFSERSVGSTTGDKNDKKTQQLKDKGKVGDLIADFSKKTFRAQAGTKITDFINSVIKVSSYVLDQVSVQANVDSPINWWKINPQIEFLDLDKGTNFYARKITYNIVPYVIRGQDSPNFGQQQVKKSEIVKLYEYIYSGNNRDVLDVNIDYQMAFFEVKNGVSTRYTKDSKDNIKDSGDSQVAVYNGYTDNRFFKPRYFHTTGIANQQNTGDTTATEKQIVAQDLMEKLFDNAGDMISLDLTIIGDPDWITQDVPLFGPILPDGSFLGSGSVNFTNPVYFNFYFATPDTDYDDTSGLFNSGGKYSQFSGIYQVISVKSNFSGGKFTQKLNNVRVRNQTAPKAPAARADSVSGSAPTASNNAGNAPRAEPATNGMAAPDSTTVTNPTASINTYTGVIRNDDFRNRGVGATDATGATNITGARGQGIIEDAGP